MGDTIDHEAVAKYAQQQIEWFGTDAWLATKQGTLARAYLDLARKAVPREPTDDMGDAGYQFWEDRWGGATGHMEKFAIGQIWRAMYDASQAPKP